MKICCPKCNATGTIPDHEVPETGRFLSCPRCHHGFDIKKPKAATGEYTVDVCPSCAYSTFGDERFATCPKCGVVIKTFVARQREEMTRNREQEILTRKFSRDTVAPPVTISLASTLVTPPSAPDETNKIDIGEMIESLHPVHLVGWGCAAAAAVICIMGLSGLLDYYGEDIRARLSVERDEQVSAWYVFLHYGLLPWIMTLYGALTVKVSLQFNSYQAKARKVLAWCLWAAIAYVPVTHLIGIIGLIMDAIPHPFMNYFVEVCNLLFMSALFGVPLFLLIRFLDDRRIRSVVNL